MTAEPGSQIWTGKVVPIPHTDYGKPDADLFTPTALGPGDIVVGTAGDTPEIFSATRGGLVTFASVLDKTSYSVRVLAGFDTSGNLYGLADKGSSVYIFKAVPDNPAPTVTITTPNNGHSYRRGTKLTAKYGCKAGSTGTKPSTCIGTARTDTLSRQSGRASTHSP